MIAISGETDSEIDWFDGLDARLPSAVFRHVAASPSGDLAQKVTAVLEMAQRSTAGPPPAGPIPGPRPSREAAQGLPRRPARVIGAAGAARGKPRLPADAGRHFLDELREFMCGDADRYAPARQALQPHGDPAVLVAGVAGALAAVLNLRPEVVGAAVAVAMTVITESGWGALNTPPRVRPTAVGPGPRPMTAGPGLGLWPGLNSGMSVRDLRASCTRPSGW